MQPVRASKRRKLDRDDTAKSSPASLQPTAADKKNKRVQSSPAVNGNGQNGGSKAEESGSEETAGKVLSAREQWLQAKAKSATRKGKRPNVYDDIEGGNVGREPYGRMTKPVKRERPTAPSKPTAAPLGFFKQFAKAKVDAAANAGVRRNRVDDDDEDDEDGSIADSEDDDQSEDQSNIQVKQTSRNGKYWTAATPGKSKKTFEDEIREVEAAARKKVAAGDNASEDELAENGEMRRSSSRKTSIQKPARNQNELKGAASPVRKASKPQPLDRRKASSVKSADVEDGASDDDIEIDDSEDGRIANHVRVSTPKKLRFEPRKSTGIKIALPPFATDHLQCIRRIVIEKCAGKRPIPLTNLADEFAKVNSLVSQTVAAGESNSMLLIGARGSGKTALIDQVLREQSIQHPNDYHIVRLSGFIHTDDKIALREIWRQLGREMEIEDNETSKNYADTLTTLLALLSHPAETGRDEEGHITKSVIFILDEFELFATHPRQTLLYNLFDIAQSRKAPIAVLGCTTRIDVAESLEKRVKSRFSHRYVHLSMSKSLQAFESVCRSAIGIKPAELEGDEKAELGGSVEGVVAKLQKAALSSTGGKSKNEHADAPPGPLDQWNTLVDAVISSRTCASFLARLFHTTKSIPEFLSSLLLAMATLPINSAHTSSDLLEHLTTTISTNALHPPDSKLSILPSLSSLQLALLICAARLTNIYNSEVISFALAYEEYKNLASKAKLQASASGALAQGAGSRVWGKSVAKSAWEGLVECGLILEDGRGGRVDVAMEEIGSCGVELGSWGRWCREI
ncbi:uncharacterized protein RCC_05419 [Ramularia collo-cygni]|uniref:Origin recognition complex subunit 4 n=1 Tax=Ramularia collo-cygni TaxID=112498 RepID=A0A2D3UW54_9PEZI|nr:uncharacterized protein RCC_05419 [Ramularia collo-cygni]CZT19568.1 uncharacterized protein RCC_05419 [Ramularia collo-cygni]